MKKRDFLKAMGVGVVATAVCAPVLAQTVGAPNIANGRPDAAVEQDFRSLAALEVKITDMVNDKSRTVLVTSTKPIVISEAKFPLAVAFAENDDKTVRMTVFSKQKDGKWTQMDYTYAGVNSSQVFQQYGVILDLFAHM